MKNILEYNTDGNEANLTDAATCYQVPMTYNAFAAIRELDLQFIGTDQYMGMAYFWHHDYKQPLVSDASLTIKFYAQASSLTIKTKP